MFCNKCGTQIADDSAYCSKCGKALNASAASSQTSTSKSRQWMWWLLTVPIVVTILMMLSPSDKKERERQQVKASWEKRPENEISSISTGNPGHDKLLRFTDSQQAALLGVLVTSAQPNNKCGNNMMRSGA
jgi:predicted nucleic acid-binding Zn ribbon protein